MLELDVRVLPPPKKHVTIHEKLKQLEPGEALRITNDHDPRPLRFELRTAIRSTISSPARRRGWSTSFAAAKSPPIRDSSCWRNRTVLASHA
jgi:hypothetical protein